MTEHLTIVGSLGRFLAGKSQRVGDIDVLIEREFCERYWDFLEILALHGVTSVRDVLDRPRYPWSYCCAQIAHARALTVECSATALDLSHANLDICFKNPDGDLDAIRNPDTTQWVDMLPFNWREWDDATRTAEISKGRVRLIDELYLFSASVQ
jgi:hypothetical protein